MALPDSPRTTDDNAGQIAQTIQLVKEYAKQETLDPLKGASRWIAYGSLGSFLLGSACVFLVLGVLRLLQTEWPGTFGGHWTRLLPYIIALGVGLLVIALAATRIGKKPLNKER
jgi:hypothetical protein